MGISIGELLSLDFFRDFQVIAGKKGLNREVQGVSILEAPDGYRWSVGKELIMSSGYVFAKNPAIDTLDLSPDFLSYMYITLLRHRTPQFQRSLLRWGTASYWDTRRSESHNLQY